MRRLPNRDTVSIHGTAFHGQSRRGDPAKRGFPARRGRPGEEGASPSSPSPSAPPPGGGRYPIDALPRSRQPLSRQRKDPHREPVPAPPGTAIRSIANCCPLPAGKGVSEKTCERERGEGHLTHAPSPAHGVIRCGAAATNTGPLPLIRCRNSVRGHGMRSRSSFSPSPSLPGDAPQGCRETAPSRCRAR